MTKADAALDRLRKWAGDSEPDLYPYLKEFFVEVLGYPRESVRINSAQKKGIPDISLISKDSVGKLQFPWVVCEVKREREIFADPPARKEVLDTQLKRYVTADTVYALLIDPGIIAVYLPDLRETKIVALKDMNVQSLQNAGDPQTCHPQNIERRNQSVPSILHLLERRLQMASEKRL